MSWKSLLAFGLPGVMEGSLLAPGFKSDSNVSSRYPPLFFSEPWQVRHFCTKIGAMSLVKLSGCPAAVAASAVARTHGAARLGNSFIQSEYNFRASLSEQNL